MRDIKWCFLAICMLFALVSPHLSFGQIPTRITNYNYKDYNGGIQNWGITVSADKILYAGNNNGLLRYNGNDWSLLEPNEERATVRAVYSLDNKVYTAGDNNIGYWEKEQDGKMVYTSLLPLVNKLGIFGDTFWSIASQGKNVYFQSFSNIIYYDGQQMGYLVKNDCYSLFFESKGELLSQKNRSSLMKIQRGELTTICDNPIIQNGEVKFAFQILAGKYLIGLSNGEIYTLENNILSFYTSLKNEYKLPIRIDCGNIWNNEILAVGSIGDGLFLIDLNEDKQTHINSLQLQDLNIHSISFINQDFIWLSLDNGISSIVLEPNMYLWKSNAEIGAFFDAAHFNGKTYIASNQGLFIYEEGGKKIKSSIFPLSLCNLKNELLCGTTTTLYKITKQDVNPHFFANINGVSQFEYIADKGDEYIFLRSYAGIALLYYDKNEWKYLSTISGSDSYASIIPENINTVWALHAEKGVFRLRINEDMTKVVGFDVFSEIDGYANYSNINIIKIEGKVLFATPQGVYSFDIAEKKFIKQIILSEQIKHLDKLQSINQAYKNNIWLAANNELFLYRITDLSAEKLLSLPFVQNEFTLYDKHLNLKSINDSVAFISTFEGTVVINNEIIKQLSQQDSLLIESISHKDKKGVTTFINFRNGQIELPNTATNISINVTTRIQTYPSSISYRIKGIANDWSPWQASGIIHFTNLPSGKYTLEVKSSKQNALVIPIEVAPAIYKRGWMISIYILILIIITIRLVMLLSERKRKTLLVKYAQDQKEHDEEMQKQAYLQLQEKAKNQENELKMQMRYLSQKQELLDSISTEIEAQKKDLGDRYPNKLYRRLIKIIKEGTTEKDKFLSFENYFVEVHYEFMLRMQQAHLELSASELKFCCLIRANLSTKEIAVIMCIAIRSVELKKYRLKQKLNLDSETSLTSYILSI